MRICYTFIGEQEIYTCKRGKGGARETNEKSSRGGPNGVACRACRILQIRADSARMLRARMVLFAVSTGAEYRDLAAWHVFVSRFIGVFDQPVGQA